MNHSLATSGLQDRRAFYFSILLLYMEKQEFINESIFYIFIKRYKNQAFGHKKITIVMVKTDFKL